MSVIVHALPHAVRVFLLLVVLIPGMARASDTVTFALFSREWPPFEWVVVNKPMGAAVDLFHAVMPQSIVRKVVPMPAPRSVLHEPGLPAYTRLESKGWMKDSSKYIWSEPVLDIHSVLYSAAGHPLEYTGPESLKGKVIGCIRNYYYPALQPLFDAGTVIRYDVNSDILLLRMAKAGRVDAAVFDDVSAAWMVREAEDLAPADYYVASKVLGTSELRFVFNPEPTIHQWLPELNRRINEMRHDGTIEHIMSRYR